MNRGDSLISNVSESFASLVAYIYELETEIRLLRQENLELTHECNDLSAANIMARASRDYSDSV